MMICERSRLLILRFVRAWLHAHEPLHVCLRALTRPAWCIGIASLVLVASGCASVPKTTALTADDLTMTATELAAKLAASDLLAERTSESPKMIIAVSKVENLSSDLIPAGEQWYIIARIRDSLPLGTLRREKNFVFVIPAEHLRQGRDQGNFPPEYAGSREPTHEMTATFRSARRTAGVDRTDTYLCDFRVTDLNTKELVWSDTVGFKRISRGVAYD